MKIRTAHFLLLSLAFGGLSVSAAAAPNKISSAMGHDLAQAKCTSCHLIERGQQNPPDHVGGPAFQAVADRPGVTRATLREHLRTTHTNSVIPLSMPNPALSHDEINKIIDYILSLKTAPTK